MFSPLLKVLAHLSLSIALVLVALASGCGEEQQTTVEVRDLTLRPGDVPSRWTAQRSDAWDAFLDARNVAVVSGADFGLQGHTTTEAEIADWGLVSTADQFYNSSARFPPNGPDFLLARVALHQDESGAQGFYDFSSGLSTQAAIERGEWGPSGELRAFEESQEPVLGDVNRVVHWISDGGARQAVEGYVVLFRRGNVVALLVVRAAVGAVRLAEIVDMATGWDNRIRELSSA